jgi:hypothetical protein
LTEEKNEKWKKTQITSRTTKTMTTTTTTTTRNEGRKPYFFDQREKGTYRNHIPPKYVQLSTTLHFDFNFFQPPKSLDIISLVRFLGISCVAFNFVDDDVNDEHAGNS